MIDYSIFFKERFWERSDGWRLPEYDILVSAYNASERVRVTYENVRAARKVWIVVPDYAYGSGVSLPSGALHTTGINESEVINEAFSGLMLTAATKLCVDITGFTRPQVIVLLEYLRNLGMTNFDVIYAEPSYYRRGEETAFAAEVVSEVRQVLGFEGDHVTESPSDALIIAIGYEDHLVTRVAEHKDYARKLRVLGFPSMQPDMYQESVLRSHRADEAIGTDRASTYFAPAYDPFVTAAVLREVVAEVERNGAANIYLAPVSTKPQALGFALFYVYERRHTSTSIIFPFTTTYAQDTAVGIGRIWRYEIDLPD